VLKSATYPYNTINSKDFLDRNFGLRFHFNGKEMDNEVQGGGNAYDYGFRIYNPRLGKFLSVDPLTKSYPTFSPFHFAGNSPIKFIDLDGMEMYAKGTVADAFVNMLSQNTGLSLARDNVTGALSYATQTVVDPITCAETCVPVVNNPNSTQVSSALRATIIKAIDGGQSIDPVTIIAMKRSEIKLASQGRDNVFFDQPPAKIGTSTTNLPEAVDMSDFTAIGSEPLLQSALIAHIVEERMNATQGWVAAHAAGNQAEVNVIKEKFPTATLRNDNTSRQNLNQTSSVFKENSDGMVFDYGALEYTTKMKNTNNGFITTQHPSEVTGVKRTK
jgi:RHS repeat-associated protein